jgi:AraC-like DNA-binding protein
MAASVDRQNYAMLATSAVSSREAFAYWREMICATFVRLVADPVTTGRFSGRIEHVPVGSVELSAVTAGSQHVQRTRSLIAQGSQEYLLASIQQRGTGRVEQDGRVATLSPGDMAFYDSTRPYTLHFDRPFHQLVVQVPKRELMVGDTRQLTARRLGRGTPGAVVATFFESLFDAAKESPAQPPLLLPHAIGLFSAAASFAGLAEPGPDAADALVRQHTLDFLRSNLADPRLDMAAVARACNVSRRTLYRMFGEEGIARRLRRMRIESAQAMLLNDPDRPVSSVAFACGFDSESGFYRAFRAATSMTPAEYRRGWHTG